MSAHASGFGNRLFLLVLLLPMQIGCERATSSTQTATPEHAPDPSSEQLGIFVCRSLDEHGCELGPVTLTLRRHSDDAHAAQKYSFASDEFGRAAVEVPSGFYSVMAQLEDGCGDVAQAELNPDAEVELVFEFNSAHCPSARKPRDFECE